MIRYIPTFQQNHLHLKERTLRLRSVRDENTENDAPLLLLREITIKER